jgi:hypothetical protein
LATDLRWRIRENLAWACASQGGFFDRAADDAFPAIFVPNTWVIGQVLGVFLQAAQFLVKVGAVTPKHTVEQADGTGVSLVQGGSSDAIERVEAGAGSQQQ